MKKLVSDGVLESTPAGSFAYNLSVHGPILSLNSKNFPYLQEKPIYKKWKGKVVSDKTKDNNKILNPSKRPISSVADNIEVRNAKMITIKQIKNKI